MTRFLAVLALLLTLSVPAPDAQAERIDNTTLVELTLHVQLGGETVMSPVITAIEGKPASIRLGNDEHVQYQTDVLVERVFIDDAGRQVVDIHWSLASAEAGGPWTDHGSGQIIALANATEPALMSFESENGPAVTVTIGNRSVEADVAAAGLAGGD